MKLPITFDRETDGRWIAEVESVPGVLVYGSTQSEARDKAEALATQVLVERQRHPGGMPRE